jgi:MoxR-like ATPase
LATQNPVELEGTFPLPEAQLDRFLMRVRLGYPSEEAEHQILLRHGAGDVLETLQPVPGPGLAALQAAATAVAVSDDVRGYIVRLSRATREHSAVELGASPRGTLYLYRAARAAAAIAGRGYVTPDDVKRLALPVLGHRVIVDPGVELRGGGGDEIVREIVDRIPVPVEP